MKKLRILQAAACWIAAACFLPCQIQAVSAEKAILMDGHTGRVLYEKRANEKSLIASTTKIMTALLICENCNVLQQITVAPEAVGVEGSSMYLQAGEKLTVQELLYGLMLSSGNDAAVALAIHAAGSMEAFVSQMNEKAQALGLDNTHFANPHGLDAAEHYSTAADLARLAAYAMENPIFAQTVGTRQVRVGQRSLSNHNRLLWQLEGAEGVKTGYTKAAGRILVSSVKRQGRRLLCVTIDDGNDWNDHATLYRQGFSQAQSQTLVTAGEVLGSMAVFGGEASSVRLLAGADLSFALFPGEQVSIRLPVKEFVYAPVTAGTAAGHAYVCVDGRPVGKIPVYYETTVERLPEKTPSFWQRLFGGYYEGSFAKDPVRPGGCLPAGGGNHDP